MIPLELQSQAHSHLGTRQIVRQVGMEWDTLPSLGDMKAVHRVGIKSCLRTEGALMGWSLRVLCTAGAMYVLIGKIVSLVLTEYNN